MAARHQELNVLVVDPDDAARRQATEALRCLGARVGALADDALAPSRVKEGRWQLLVLDVTPGRTGGVETLRQVRAVDDDLCVIATTAAPSVGTAVEAMRHAAFHYLPKPLDGGELGRVVDEAVRERGLLVDLEQRLNRAVGGRVRERRKRRGLTLKQLANRTGLSVSLISQIELGKSAASVSTLHRLAAALGVPMTYFFETV